MAEHCDNPASVQLTHGLQSCCQGLGSVCEIDVDREGLAGIDTLHPSRRWRRVFGGAGYGFQGGPARQAGCCCGEPVADVEGAEETGVDPDRRALSYKVEGGPFRVECDVAG